MRRIGLSLVLLVLSPGLLWAQQARFLVSADWLEENLSRPDLVLLHASYDGKDYREGHIPGARLVLLDQIAWDGAKGVGVELRSFPEIREALQAAGVSSQSTVVVYGTNLLHAARLWMTLDVAGAGASAPLFLDGGLPVWKSEGRALSTDEPSFARGRLVLRPRPQRLVSAEWILVRLGHDDLSLLDARPDDEFTGADGGLGGRVNPGHIPGARQLYWEELLVGQEEPRFRPVAELATLFHEAGADPEDKVVTYCQVGLRASVTYLVARMLGYDTRFFDGSWREWGTTDYPFYPRRAVPPSSNGG